MADGLHAAGHVRASYKEALLAREERFPTGLPTQVMAVAIPHTDVEHVERSFISVARLAEPVAFHEMGANATVDVQAGHQLATPTGPSQARDPAGPDRHVLQTRPSWSGCEDAPDDRALYDVVIQQVSTLAA